MDGMRPPQLPEQPVGVVRAEHLARLLRSCEGRDFTSRRDTAIILLLLTIWHDEAPLQHRYAHRASTVLNGHRAKLLLSGQADPASLELASKLVGDEAVLQTSETTGRDGRASLTESVAYRRLLPPEALRQLKPRRALLVYGHLPPVRIRLLPRHSEHPFNAVSALGFGWGR
jgi:hypothetical protein